MPRALQACKGEEKEMWLDPNKRGEFKGERRQVYSLCMVSVVDGSRSLLK